MDATSSKVILLTGGNSGIGLEACKILCRGGHKVITTVRSAEKGEHCLSEVIADVSNADVQYIICDVSNPSSIRECVRQLNLILSQRGLLLDVIINNAGIAPAIGPQLTMCPHNPDWEIAVATNCLGPILLADLLTENLKQTASVKGEARIVMVNSSLILNETLCPYQTDVNNVMLNGRHVYNGEAVIPYKNSKVSLMLATQALARQLEGTNVRVVSMCPGVIPSTGLARHNTRRVRALINCAICCLSILLKPQSVRKGGGYVAAMATDNIDGTSSELLYIRGKGTQLTPQCHSTSNQEKMLQVVRDLTKSEATSAEITDISDTSRQKNANT